MTLPDMGPAVWSQRHPLLVLLLALLVLFGGLLAVGRLPIDPLSFNGYARIHVRIQDPGVPAAIMEERVAQPLEQVLADIPGLTHNMSRSVVGSSEVALLVGATGNIDAVERQVAERLARVLEKLPATIDAPILTRHTGADLPVAELLLGSSTLTLAQLQKWAEDSLIPQFTDIPGFARYEIIGGPLREIQVIPDQRRLAALGLNLEDVVDVLRRYKGQTAALGQISVAQTSAQAVESLTLRLTNGDTVALSEVARAQEGERQDGARVYRDAAPVLRLLLYPQPGSSALEMGEACKARLAWLRANSLIPQAVRVEWLAHPLLGLKRMGRSYLTLSSGVWLLTWVVIGVLYRRARAVWLSAGAAIISLMLVFIYYKLAGLAINVLSLGGMLVGYAFVLGLPLMTFDSLRQPVPGEDATAARVAIQHRLMTLLLIAVLVLLPVVVFGGLLGLVFQALVTGLLATLTASVLASLVWVPAFAGPPATAGVSPWAKCYAQWLARLQSAPRWPATGALLVLMVIPLGLYHMRDNLGFLPPWDTGELRLRLVLPPGLDRKQAEPVLRALEDVARRNGGVQAILTQMGSMDTEPADGTGPNEAVLRIELQAETPRRRSVAAWSHDFERLLAASPPLGSAVRIITAEPSSVTRFEDPIMLATSGEVSLRVFGPDREVLAGIGEGLRARLAVVPGLRQVRLASGGEQSEQVAQLDPQRAMQWAGDDITLARVLRIAQGGLVIGRLPDASRGVGIRMVLPPLSSIEGLPRLLLRGESDNHAAVYLADVATGHMAHRSLTHWREHQLPMVEVRAALAADAATQVVVRNLRTILQESVMPVGYQVRLLGFIDSMQRSLKHVLVLLGACIIILLLLLGLRLRTWGGALLVLLNVLFALVGGVVVMAWSGLPVSLPMGLGAVLLVAMGAVPPLLAVDVLRSQRGSGAPDASWAQRIVRPMLIFGVGGLLSLLPLASGLVPGFELLQPLALVLCVGLCFSLLGSIFLIPVLYRWTGR
jgi:multidrug efflux pump subunit AcrB